MREEARAVWLWPSLEALWQDATYTLRDLRRNPDVHARRDAHARARDRRQRRDVLARRSTAVSPAGAAWSIRRRCTGSTCTGRLKGKESGDRRPVRALCRPRAVVDGVLADGGVSARRRSPSASGRRRASGTSRSSARASSASSTRRRSLGRYFTASEDAPPNPAPVAVLSHALWETQFGSRRDVLGTDAAASTPSPTRSSASRPRDSSACGRIGRRRRSFPSRRTPPARARRTGRRHTARRSALGIDRPPKA